MDLSSLALKNVPSVVCFFSVFLGIPTKPVSAAMFHRVLLKKTPKLNIETSHIGQENVSLAWET